MPRRTRQVIALGLLGLSLVLVLSITMRTPLKDDVAWLLYVARKWMGGQRLYVDLIEVNPPLIIWLSAVPALLAGWLGTVSRMVAMPFFASLVLASAWWSASILRGLGPRYQDRVTVFALIGAVMFLVAGNELGQREHLLTAAALPYLCIVALSLQGRVPGRAEALAAGILAALGCALKPGYGFAFAAVEVLAMTRGLRPWRLANLGALAVAIGYAASVLIFYPAYIERAVPLALALYGATDVTFPQLLADSSRMLLGLAALLVVLGAAWRARQAERWVLSVLAAFAAAAVLVCFADGKNWFYHRLPGTTAAGLGLVLWLLTIRDAVAPARRPVLARLLTVLTLCVFTAGAVERIIPRLVLAVDPDVSTEARLERLLKHEKARSYVAFSEWIALGFPVVNNTGVTWTSRFDSMWALKGELWRSHFDPNAIRDYPVSRWVARDFVAGCPDVVVVDMRQGLNYVGVLTASDPAFARAWSNYAQITAFDGLRVYRRQSPDCTTLYADDSPVVAFR